MVFDPWILFNSYDIFYLTIGVAIAIWCTGTARMATQAYPHDDTETVTFVLMAVLTTVVAGRSV